MRLTFSACKIVLKRGFCIISCAVLCLFAAAAVLALLFAGSDFQPARLAVISHDDSGYMEPIINSVIDSGFKQLISVDFCDSAEEADGCAAVLTLPEHFFESVMSGENIAPSLQVNVSSPIEGAWIAALAKNAARLLSSAQDVIDAVNRAMIADQIPFEQRQRLIFYTDIELLDDYLTRKGRFESIELSATGSLSVIEYYAASGVAFILFLLVFLVFSPIKELKDFSAFSKKHLSCFAAAFLGCFIISFLLTALGAFSIGAKASALLSPQLFTAALLLCSMMLFFPTVCRDSAVCAALSFGSCLIQAVFGGGILPEVLLPSSIARLSGFMPLTVMRRLIADAAFNCGFSSYVSAVIWCVVPLFICLMLWTSKEANV